jgi:hypothetical protein
LGQVLGLGLGQSLLAAIQQTGRIEIAAVPDAGSRLHGADRWREPIEIALQAVAMVDGANPGVIGPTGRQGPRADEEILFGPPVRGVWPAPVHSLCRARLVAQIRTKGESSVKRA